MYDVSRAIVDDRLRQAEQARLVRRIRTRDRRADDAERRVAVGQLRGLVARTGELPLRDDVAWSGLRTTARDLTGRLHAGGLLPRHLVVGTRERPAVVIRGLVAAIRRLERAVR